VAQTFFSLDGGTHQPLGFGTETSARTVSAATPELLALAAAVRGPETANRRMLANAEPFTTKLLDRRHHDTRCHPLVPMLRMAHLPRRRGLPDDALTRRWHVHRHCGRTQFLDC
jgi:hypothetical protein